MKVVQCSFGLCRLHNPMNRMLYREGKWWCGETCYRKSQAMPSQEIAVEGGQDITFQLQLRRFQRRV
ncbi:MAG TPA: hypothetical protein VJZ94_00070 [Candidatus Paceibacterota bacterium]|nr:hypothetical protein [Candidatus Paceibacterota bacterium]